MTDDDVTITKQRCVACDQETVITIDGTLARHRLLIGGPGLGPWCIDSGSQSVQPVGAHHMTEITDYQQLHQLAGDTLVRDSSGEVWQIEHHDDTRTAETWLLPFSDEYAFTVRADGTHHNLGGTPTLPITVIDNPTPADDRESAHLRIDGWCDTCGGTGEPNIRHINHTRRQPPPGGYLTGGLSTIEATAMHISEWLGQREPSRGHAYNITLRILKVQEEAGEAAQAWIGYLGQNPRRGTTHTVEQVCDELVDVAVTALVALWGLAPNPPAALDRRLKQLRERTDG